MIQKLKDINFLLKWGGCFLTIMGAILTSFQVTPFNVWCYNIGAGLYFVWSARIKEPNLMMVNGTLLLIYIIGCILPFFR